jgi:hypothetical protein
MLVVMGAVHTKSQRRWQGRTQINWANGPDARSDGLLLVEYKLLGHRPIRVALRRNLNLLSLFQFPAFPRERSFCARERV